jgi:hypothetical protein
MHIGCVGPDLNADTLERTVHTFLDSFITIAVRAEV